jgi:hypothetical protein
MPSRTVLDLATTNYFLDRSACSIGLWRAVVRVSKDAQAIMLKNSVNKVVVFGFRGTKAYSLNVNNL